MVVQEIQQDLDAGNLDNIYVRDDDTVGGPDIPLSEVHARQQQQQEMPEHPEVATPATGEGLDERPGSSSNENGDITNPTLSATAAAAGETAAEGDVMSLGHDRIPPEAEMSRAGQSVSSNLEKEGQEESPVSDAGTGASAVNDSMLASPDGTKAVAEQRSGSADRGWEAKKLVKQQELFGRSFSKPRRHALRFSLDAIPACTNVTELCC